MIYELWINGVESGTGDRKALIEKANAQDLPWELYMIVKSTMNEVRINMVTKLSIRDFKNIKAAVARGVGSRILERQYHIGHNTLVRIINQTI